MYFMIHTSSPFSARSQMLDDDEYNASGGKVPLRWTAPEALFFRKFSCHSDAWSFGCILHEIFNDGDRPYAWLSNNEVLDFVDEGRRLPPAAGCPTSVYALMIDLWHPEAAERPSMSHAAAQLNAWMAAGESNFKVDPEASRTLQFKYCPARAAENGSSTHHQDEVVYGALTDGVPRRKVGGASDGDAYCWGFGECFVPKSALAGNDWMFGPLDRAQAERILRQQQQQKLRQQAAQNGKAAAAPTLFLVRTKPEPATYVLSIISGTRFAHHKLRQLTSQVWLLNDKSVSVRGPLESLLKWLRVAHPDHDWNSKLGQPASRKVAEQQAGVLNLTAMESHDV